MLRNVLLAILVGLGALVVASAMRHPATVPSRTAPSTSQAAPQPAPAAARPAPQPAVLPDAPPETPALDMIARLATRRRLDREGNLVYLDSMLAHTDSVLTRWVDHSALTVALVADSTLPGWTPALLAEARAAMRAWDNNGSGMALREIANADSADIKVHWVVVLRDSGQVGVTTLSWGTDGVVRSAVVNLALRRNPDSAVVPPAMRVRVAVHEFGHALGLPHSDDAGDIMFRVAPGTAPSSRDQATLRLLYAVSPGPLRIP